MNSISKSIGTASLSDDTQSFAFDALSFDPEEFGFVSLLDTQSFDQEKFSLEDVPQLEEECTSNVSPFKRDRCPDNWEAVQSVAKRRFVEPPIGRCGCKKSKCIMLYCNCFLYGLQCIDDCTCKQCANTESGNSPGGAATNARAVICQKNPNAFNGREKKQGTGCLCKTNRCLKRYCSCFKQGISCEKGSCVCIDCKNSNSTKTVICSFGQSRARDERAEK